MADPRVTKLAQVLVKYSLTLKPGETLFLNTTPLAQELNLAVYKEAMLAGAHILAQNRIPGAQELFFKHASDEQLEYISPVYRQVAESFDAQLQKFTGNIKIDTAIRTIVRAAYYGNCKFVFAQTREDFFSLTNHLITEVLQSQFAPLQCCR